MVHCVRYSARRYTALFIKLAIILVTYVVTYLLTLRQKYSETIHVQQYQQC